MTFVEVLKATIVIGCFEKFVKCRFVIIEKSEITSYIYFV